LYAVRDTRRIAIVPNTTAAKPLAERKALVMTGPLKVSPRLACLVHPAYRWHTTRSPRRIDARRFG
jgi:hypothetical protein